MRQQNEQIGLNQVPKQFEADPVNPNPWINNFRKATKLAAVGIVAAALSGCTENETEYYEENTPVESTETAQKNPHLFMTTFNENYTAFSMVLKNAKDLHLEFSVSRQENPEETFIVSTSGETKGPYEVAILDVIFNEPVEDAVVITKVVNLDTGEEMPLENHDPVSEGAIKGTSVWPVPQE